MGASQAQAITPASFAAGVVFCTVAGTILAMVLARRAANPARAFLRTSLILVAVSLVFPLAASHTATSTRLTLALGHLIAAAIVIPLITLRLARARHPRAREPRNT
jgi:heme A synthase